LNASAGRIWRGGVTVRLAYAVVSLFVLAIFLHEPGINHYSPSSFERMVSGTAQRPFVYRALVPVMVRTATAAIPMSTRERLVKAAQEQPALRAVCTFCDKIPAERFPEFVVAVVVMYASLVGFALALRRLFERLFRAPDGFRDKVPLLALLLLPPFFCYTSFIYDFPALLFFTLALDLMARARWGAYLSIFVLSCFNKETTILLAVVFAIQFLRGSSLGRAAFYGLLAAQLIAYVGIKTGLSWIYRENPGAMVEYHLDHNFALLRPYPLSTAAAWLGVVLLVIHRWSDKPVFMRRGLWILAPLVGLTLFLGYLDELRDYYEAFPIVVLMMSHSVARLAGIEVSAAPDEEERSNAASPATPRPRMAGAPLLPSA
jgi:hypothetical protein